MFVFRTKSPSVEVDSEVAIDCSIESYSYLRKRETESLCVYLFVCTHVCVWMCVFVCVCG